jgi:stearoyl-CoA desaturase (delta-9 desaturase)
MTTSSDVIEDAAEANDDSAISSATLGGEQKRSIEQITLLLFITVPFLALVAAVPLAWGWGLSWLDLGLLVFMYYLGCHGITIGFHRYFTHGSFKARRPLRIALATRRVTRTRRGGSGRRSPR